MSNVRLDMCPSIYTDCTCQGDWCRLRQRNLSDVPFPMSYEDWDEMNYNIVNDHWQSLPKPRPRRKVYFQQQYERYLGR